MKKLFFAVFAALMLMTGCGGVSSDAAEKISPDAENSRAENTASPEGTLTVTMLDVGQGDAILIRTADETIMIDAGDLDERDRLRRELAKNNVSVIDKVILTHPHADHIGGVDVLLKEYDVKAVYDNDVVRDAPFYINYLKLLKTKNLKRQTLKEGDRLDFGGGASFVVFGPTEDAVNAWNAEFENYVKNKKKNAAKPKHNFNEESIVGRLDFGDVHILFTGDVEKEGEARLAQKYAAALKSDVLKAPHHGSKTSSSQEFLNAVRPDAALMSLGAGNDYGHPHAVTLKRYEKNGIATYRTDLNGAITIVTDGKTYSITPEKETK